jgi:hypothetical protein
LEDLECTSTIGQDEKHQRRNLIHHIKANKLFLPIDQSSVFRRNYIFFIGNGGMGRERERAFPTTLQLNYMSSKLQRRFCQMLRLGLHYEETKLHHCSMTKRSATGSRCCHKWAVSLKFRKCVIGLDSSSLCPLLLLSSNFRTWIECTFGMAKWKLTHCFSVYFI